MEEKHRQIQWFPGHMNKTRRLIESQLNRIDIVVEILDARFPQSSRNPLLEEITTGKPMLLILNKSDLAEPSQTDKWLEYYKSKGFFVSSVSASIPKTVKGILNQCRSIVENFYKKKGMKINILITGIPNVGKSTIINTLRKQKKASVQNKPGHTKDFQRIVFSNTLTLIDTPGILWHKFDPDVGYRLAVFGSIKDSILDITQIALAAIVMLKNDYSIRLIERYQIEKNDLLKKEEDIITLIGKKRGMLQKGGRVDYFRACEIIVREIRDGKLGLMTVESPKKEDNHFF